MYTYILLGGGDGIGQALVRAVLEVKGKVTVIGVQESPSEDFWEATSLAGGSQIRYYRYYESKKSPFVQFFRILIPHI